KKLLSQPSVEIEIQRTDTVEGSNACLEKSDPDKALTLSRHPLQVEKGLPFLLNADSLYAKDFLNGFTAPLGVRDVSTLKTKGKKWGYGLPTSWEQELDMIEATLCERLFEAGVVAVGTHNGKRCFCVAAFGEALSED